MFINCGLLDHNNSPKYIPKIIIISLSHTCCFLVSFEVTPHSFSESDRSLKDLLSESSSIPKQIPSRQGTIRLAS